MDAGVHAEYFAGHSLGEYSALCAGGVLSAEDTLALVTERGRLMERESAANPGAMSAILKLAIAEVHDIVAAASKEGVVVAANHNSEMQIVISGEAAGVEAASTLAGERGGRAIALPVSGAWHSPLVAAAVPDFEKAMEKATFSSPSGKIFFNVTAAPETDAIAIQSIMSRQIASLVKWYDIILTMHQQGVTTFIEVGAKKVLSGLLKKILPKGHGCTCLQVEDQSSLAACVETLREN